MLIQFSVENFRSIREKQTFSMVASSSYDDHKVSNLIEIEAQESLPPILNTAVIFGPNGSGKSTFIEAVKFVEHMVLNSAKEQEGDKIDLKPFRLSAATREKDSEFEIIFFEDGIRYQFGFCANTNIVTEEWLFAYPNGHVQKWYQRIFDREKEEYVYHFSTKFKGGKRKEDWKKNTRSNMLFLSGAVQQNCEQLISVFAWFQKRLAIIDTTNLSDSYTTMYCKNEESKEKVQEFLNKADLSIKKINFKTKMFNPDELPSMIPEELKKEFIKQLTGKEIPKITFLHSDIDTDELVEFEMDEESTGTQTIFALAGPCMDILKKDRVVLMDELNTSLHPLIVHQLVKLFNQTNGKSQLIFTTHDTSILSQKILRRDQVWFIEKDDKQSSNLYPLSKYTIRANESLEKGYLSGRYGAIPFLTDL